MSGRPPSPVPDGTGPLGRIITFYSYKGGTGRSMALANVAWLLALNGYRVLTIDWDLEAPGLHRYFHPFLDDKELQSTQGLIDMVDKLAAHAAASSEPLSADEVDIINYIEPLEWPRNSPYQIKWKQFGPRAGIDLMPAGRQGPAYSRKLSAFNWIDFYERLGGRRLLEAARQQMRGIYDYVLIDSRTGVSDTSGICTVEMPDTLVLCFTLNDQSIRGASSVAESIREGRPPAESGADGTPKDSGGPPPVPFRIFPVPTRVEITSERDKREAALDLAQKTFAPCLSHLPTEAHSRYWGAVQMAYFPYYAFEEIPAVFADKPNELLSLTTAIKELTRAITKPTVSEIPLLAGDAESAEKIRREIVRWYLRPVRPADAVQTAQQIWDSFDESKRTAMRRTLVRLVSIGPTSGAAPKSIAWSEIRSADQWMAEQLVDRRLLLAVEGDGLRTVRFRDPVVVEKWDTLRRWVDEDRPFLLWRAAVTASLESWRLSEHDDNALLRGKLLDEAPAWLKDRPDDLNDAEREYIRASLVDAERLRTVKNQVTAQAAEAQARVDHLETLLKSAAPVHDAPKLPEKRLWSPSAVLGGVAAILILAVVFALQFYQSRRSAEQAYEQRAIAAAQAAEAARVRSELEKTTAEQAALIKQLAAQSKQAQQPQRRPAGDGPTTPRSEPKVPTPTRDTLYQFDLGTHPGLAKITLPPGLVQIVLTHRLPDRLYRVVTQSAARSLRPVDTRFYDTLSPILIADCRPVIARGMSFVDEEDVMLAGDELKSAPGAEKCADVRQKLLAVLNNSETAGSLVLAAGEFQKIVVERLTPDKKPEKTWITEIYPPGPLPK